MILEGSIENIPAIYHSLTSDKPQITVSIYSKKYIDRDFTLINTPFIESLIKKNHDEWINNNLCNGDVVYFCKSSLVHRDKAEEYFKNKGVSYHKTNRINLANTFVINENEFKYFKTKLVAIPSSLFKSVKYNGDVVDSNFVSTNYFFESENPETLWNNFPTNPYKNLTMWRGEPASRNFFEFISAWNDLPNRDNIKIVLDSTIIKTINNNNIDLNQYLFLSELLNSKSKDDKNIAVEIVSNANPETEKIFILMLMYKYRDSFRASDNRSIKAMKESYFKFLNKDYQRFYSELLKMCKAPDEFRAIEMFLEKYIRDAFKIDSTISINNKTN